MLALTLYGCQPLANARSVAPVSSYDELELAYDVLDGLSRPFKELSSRFLYDGRGSELFEQILDLPEYYQGRTEVEILRSNAGAIIQRARPSAVIDVGAGSGDKAIVLLEALSDPAGVRYLPFDMSSDMLKTCRTSVSRRLPKLGITPVEGDMTNLPSFLGDLYRGDRPLITMFGGTIGNLFPGARRRFLRSVASLLEPSGHALVGVDLMKDPRVLEEAYDDSAGVTAQFNLNLLRLINDRLDADFPLDAFGHVVVFDELKGWIEMRLRVRRRCIVRLRAVGATVYLEPGEEIRTEVSAKFTRDAFEAELAWAGLRVADWFTDADEHYALPLIGAAVNVA